MTTRTSVAQNPPWRQPGSINAKKIEFLLYSGYFEGELLLGILILCVGQVGEVNVTPPISKNITHKKSPTPSYRMEF